MSSQAKLPEAQPAGVSAQGLESEPARDLITGVYTAVGEAERMPSPPDLAALGFHDLGLYELLYLGLLLLPALLLLDRRARQPGYFACVFAALYMPVRFGLDFLRVGDVRYSGLTPAQWVAVVVMALLPVVWWRVRAQRPWDVKSDGREPVAKAA